jgi:hypothetical protein
MIGLEPETLRGGSHLHFLVFGCLASPGRSKLHMALHHHLARRRDPKLGPSRQSPVGK